MSNTVSIREDKDSSTKVTIANFLSRYLLYVAANYYPKAYLMYPG